jgi:hypothetical protein
MADETEVKTETTEVVAEVTPEVAPEAAPAPVVEAKVTTPPTREEFDALLSVLEKHGIRV